MSRSPLTRPLLPLFGALLALCLAAPAAAVQQRENVHTLQHVREHLERVSRSPYVRPTLSADERLVIGRTRGWPGEPLIPQQDVFAYELTDLSVTGPKVKVVLATGNHNTEWSGTWGYQGAIDFLLSDAPEAAALRRAAVFYCYPNVNPDGRYTLRGRGNPEMAQHRQSDHNRIWNTRGISTSVDLVTAAMKRDTGGTADYLLDFHSSGRGTFFYTPAELENHPLAQAFVRRDSITRTYVLETERIHPGMLHLWSMSEEGLRATAAYVPEYHVGLSAERSMELGRNYLLGIYDVVGGGDLRQRADEELDLARLPLPRPALAGR